MFIIYSCLVFMLHFCFEMGVAEYSVVLLKKIYAGR